jgi:hypothetical protein
MDLENEVNWMIKLRQLKPEGSDCTTPYEVILDKPYTLGAFIKQILIQRPNEWGYFEVPPYVERSYKNSKLISFNFSYDILDELVESVTASGGWSRMDYHITLKQKESKPKEELISMLYVDYVYDIVKNETKDLDAIYEDFVIHLVGHTGLTELRENKLVEYCGVVQGRSLLVLCDKEKKENTNV